MGLVFVDGLEHRGVVVHASAVVQEGLGGADAGVVGRAHDVGAVVLVEELLVRVGHLDEQHLQ